MPVISGIGIGESKNGKTFLVERAGWHGKKHQHYIPKADCRCRLEGLLQKAAAEMKVRQMWKDGEIVLSGDDFASASFTPAE